MTDNNKKTDKPYLGKPKEEELTPEELREKKIKERIEELRKRDPFIYR